MRRLLFIAILIIASIRGYADTIDFCNVYHNSKKIWECNFADYGKVRIGEVSIKASTIKEPDSLILKFFSDTPHSKCSNHLDVLNEDSVLVTLGKSTGSDTPVKVSLWKILEDYRRKGLPKYMVLFSQGSQQKLLLTLRLE